ncbi:hypothetical protein EVAR_78407_1 [Eumeta japonica]|uniref:Uncharacterized protein n=1 Tax=Eumeta variegata TaxID=151549 RepID=A0A4C1T3J9_EUMVA|nr:hypothetical protein EVAR_78407_1 [Eumeta japonica]
MNKLKDAKPHQEAAPECTGARVRTVIKLSMHNSQREGAFAFYASPAPRRRPSTASPAADTVFKVIYGSEVGLGPQGNYQELNMFTNDKRQEQNRDEYGTEIALPAVWKQTQERRCGS